MWAQDMSPSPSRHCQAPAGRWQPQLGTDALLPQGRACRARGGLAGVQLGAGAKSCGLTCPFFPHRLSFYSGHSSFGMYCMMFLAVSAVPRAGGESPAGPDPGSALSTPSSGCWCPCTG